MSHAATSSMPNIGPAFLTAEECRTWLAAQPLASTVQMQSLLQRQLGLLNRQAIAATERLAILEVLRESLYRTQEECQARFMRRPIPLALPEQAAFDSSQATWRVFADGYTRCLEALLSGDTAIRPRAAQIIERILSTLVDQQTDIYRSSTTPSPSHWHSLHQCIEVAETLGVLTDPVKDRLRNPDMPVSIESTYAEAFLLHSASPFELNPRQMVWVTRWARRWSKKVSLHSTPPESRNCVPFYVALDQSAPATHKPLREGTLRYLDTSELRHSLKKRLQGLANGETPASLQLGEDCTQPATEQLLTRIYARWCKDVTPRRHERRPGTTQCLVSGGFDGSHSLCLGTREFRLPGTADFDKLRREREQIATLGKPVEAAKLDKPSAPASAEHWQIVDESASGMRLRRASGKGRVAVGMLIGLQAEGARNHLLASIRWAVVGADGAIEMGVELMPGEAEAVAIGGTAAGAKTISYERALLLPSIAALKETSSLVIPHGWFEAGRVIELHDGKVQKVRLGQPLERGRDFDRVTFSEAG